MATFTYQTIGYAGTDISFTAPTGGVLGDSIPSTDAKGFFWVKNVAAGGTITVTIHVPGTTFGINNPDSVVSIPDGEQRMIGPLVADIGDPAVGGGVLMTIAGTLTGVTAAAVKVP